MPVIANRLQHAAERRMDNAPNGVHCDQHHGGDEEMVGQVGGERRAGHALQAVLAAGKVGPFEGDLIEQLREGKRQQREIDPAATQDDGAEHEPERGGKYGAEQDAEERIRGDMNAGQSGGVARGAEECRRPERYEPGVTEQQIEAHGIERIDRDLGRERPGGAEPRQRERKNGKDDGGDQDRMQDAAQPTHSNRSQLSPSSPRGRSSRTRTISAYITALEAAGQNWIVSATENSDQ